MTLDRVNVIAGMRGRLFYNFRFDDFAKRKFLPTAMKRFIAYVTVLNSNPKYITIIFGL